jgi:hypothetical protein
MSLRKYINVDTLVYIGIQELNLFAEIKDLD